jgi:outer membrane protein assembly factor BamB
MLAKYLATLTISLVVAAASAGATLGDVVCSFRAPGPSVRGMARSPTRLHVLVFGNPTRIYRVSPTTGSVYGSWSIPCGDNCRGLAFSEGGHLWVGNYDTDCVYDCAATTGSVYRSWNAGHDPFGLAAYCTGDGGVGTTAILSSAYVPSKCWRHAKADGRVLSSFAIEKASYFDIAWDHRNRLVWMGSPLNSVYGYDLSGSIVASFEAPGTHPYGMAYYDECLWVGCDGNDYIYRVKCPGNIGVAPTSIGRIKALYR